MESKNVVIFDTTMRDGELMTGVQMNVQQKMLLAKMLEASGVDVIEIGYPGHFAKDFDEIVAVSKILERAIACGLASKNPDEIRKVAEALKFTERGRIHTYTPVNLMTQSRVDQAQVLDSIKDSISLARNLRDDVEWSAFDATRSDPDFLCRAVEVAIAAGASTVSIPDTMGLSTPEEFAALIQTVFHRVPNIDQAIISVHCHDDRGMAVENAIAALHVGARQVECSINGIGARKGNTDLAKLVTTLLQQDNYRLDIRPDALCEAATLVTQICTHD
jgi:2-isopropylmalate synthase